MKQIEILSSADHDLISIENYILTRWSIDVLIDFYDKYDRALKIISSDHILLSQYEDTEFRKYNLTQHNMIIYKIESDIVYIVRVLQNYQDPEGNYKSLQV